MPKGPLTDFERSRIEAAATSRWLAEKPWEELWELFELTQQTGNWNLRSITKGTMARLVRTAARDFIVREELVEDRDAWKEAAEFYRLAVLAVRADLRALTVQLRAARGDLGEGDLTTLCDTQDGDGGALSFDEAPSEVFEELEALVETLFAFRGQVARTCVDAAQDHGRANALREAHTELADRLGHRDDVDAHCRN